MVVADRVQIQQVLINLFRNAFEAMDDTRADQREIVISTWVEGGFVLAAVEDRGAGIPEEISDRLFDAFFTTKQDGMGMGLAICRTIIESQDGRLNARSNGAQGAKFQFQLPIAVEI